MNDHTCLAVLFDFDGTLAPNLDLPGMRRQVISLTQRYRVPERVYQDQYIVEIIETATAWLQRHAPDEHQHYHQQAHDLIRAFEIQAAIGTAPFPGIRDKLAQLRSWDLKLAVVTRNCRDAVLQVFPDLLEFIDVLHARDDTRFLKPDPRHLQASLDHLGVRADHSVMIGDGALDMRSGRALKMRCIGVLGGSANALMLQEAGAHQIIERCTDLERQTLQPV